MKKVLVQSSFPGMTAKQYDQAWVDLRTAGQSTPQGLLHHVGVQQGNTWMMVDVWVSEESFNKFGESLIPIFVKLGVDVSQMKPVITPVHYEYSGVD